MIGLAHFLAPVAILAAHAAAAQTVAEAAAVNVQVGLGVCARNYLDPTTIPQALRDAGFVEAGVEQWPEGQVDRIYAAPADTAAVTYSEGPAGPICRVSSGHIDVAEALPLGRRVFETLFPGQVETGSPEGANVLPGTPEAQQDGCSGFQVFAPRLLIWVRLHRAGNDGTCISDGTSQFDFALQ